MAENSPKPPDHLNLEAKKKWRELQSEYGIEDGGGLLLLDTILEAWEQMQASRVLLDAEGMIIENPSTGCPRLHPAAALLKESRSSFYRGIGLLGICDIVEE